MYIKKECPIQPSVAVYPFLKIQEVFLPTQYWPELHPISTQILCCILLEANELLQIKVQTLHT